ncbi:MAG: Fic family protein [Verrucomicrobiales bacterium]
MATIESVGSSTRIEGARLSDQEVAQFLGALEAESFQSRDEEDVAGYAYVMETVQTAWESLSLTQSIVFQLHRDLLRYSTKDERHRGDWKSLPNHVAAFDASGKEVGIVFETASPFDTPQRMEGLLQWHAREEAEPTIHPLLRMGAFVVDFLAIHPFQDGNGRLSRILTNLLLLRAGYAYVSFSSLESVIEHNKEGYYLALRRTQTSLQSGGSDWEPWVLFFLRSLKTQIKNLRQRLDDKGAHVEKPQSLPEHLSPLAGQLLELLRQRETLTLAEAAEALGANRNTLKLKFKELVNGGEAKLFGQGRGAHYRQTGR